MLKISLGALLFGSAFLPAHAADHTPAAKAGDCLYQDDFKGGLSNWIVEQQPGGTVQIEDGKLSVHDKAGCTVWFKAKLKGPVIIAYDAKVCSDDRVSDLNCFWMATDPSISDNLFAEGHGRTGKFSTYDSLKTYYVGYGGNTNSTTRFRRYDGSGMRPLLPEHDLKAEPYLLKGDHVYHIQLVAMDGLIQYIRDGAVILEYNDPEPLTEGWFGFRTVWSHIEFSNFRVFRAEQP